MSKLIALFLLSISVAFGDGVTFNADGSITLNVSDYSDSSHNPNGGVATTIDQWVTTTGPVQSGFLYIYDKSGASLGFAGANLSIGGVVTGGGFTEGGWQLYGTDETPFFDGFFVPFTLGQPFEITTSIYLNVPPRGGATAVGFQISAEALTGQYAGTDLYLTGSEAIQTSSAPSTPEPGTGWLLLGAGVAVCVAKICSAH